MFAAISFELKKIYTRKKYIFMFMLQMIFCIVVSLVMLGNSYINFLGISTDPTHLLFTILTLFSSVILPLLIFMLQSDMFSYEFENSSIKIILLRPISRINIFISKILASIIYIFFNILFIFFITAILQIVLSNNFENILHAFIAYVITILPLTVFIISSAFISINISNTSMTIVASIIFYLILTTTSIIFPTVGAVLFTSYTSFYKLFMSVMPLDIILNSTFLLISNILIFFILGFLSFDNKEF